MTTKAKTKYNLSYFLLTRYTFGDGGRAEPIRLAFHIGGVDFVDTKIPMKDWMEVKPTKPYGQLPTLDVEGHGTICGSNACLRFVGKITNLYPTEAFAASRIDEVLDLMETIAQQVEQTMFIKNSDEKIQKRKEVVEKVLPILHKLEPRVTAGGYVVGDQMTVGDLRLWSLVKDWKSGRLDGIPTDCISEDIFPNLNSIYNNVEQHQAVKDFYNK